MNHTSDTEGAIMLSSLKNDVLRVNRENLDKITSEARWYKCLDTFQWSDVNRSERALEKNENREEDGSLTAMVSSNSRHSGNVRLIYAQKESRYETHLQLKQGQRVVLLANIDPAAGLVNGAQGEVVNFKPYEEKELPKAPDKRGEDGDLRGDHAKYREGQIKTFGRSNNRQAWPVVRFLNGVTRTILAECMPNELGTEQPYCLLSRTQIPLTAGYAITIHKSQVRKTLIFCAYANTSQGMTLERVTVDLARAFEPSQIYVACEFYHI
jgi:ATP-dependent DNA helicase PIF1